MAKTVQAVRGMNDILPAQTPYWQCVEEALRTVAASYGYQEIRFPVVETTELFKRSIGEVTDIVEKEMYTFKDRNEDSITLRPEGTAGCVRAGIEHGLLFNQVQRFWYIGPMFRHERPQKGRYRQFHQFGVEAFGLSGPDIDAEQILMIANLWEKLGLRGHISLQVNSLGSVEARRRYRDELVAYFEKRQNELDADSQRRLYTNPLRILDSKNAQMEQVIASAPRLPDYLDEASKAHFDGLRTLLDAAGIVYTVNPMLVRGLDYYAYTVFEWVTTALGSQGAVCAGGRYDDLVEQLGGKATPAVGYALGLERLVSLLESVKTLSVSPHAYFVMVGDAAAQKGFLLAEKLRRELPWLRVVCHYGKGDFRQQFKRANKSGATVALILAENEVKSDTLSIKYLRVERPQEIVTHEQLAQFLTEHLAIG